MLDCSGILVNFDQIILGITANVQGIRTSPLSECFFICYICGWCYTYDLFCTFKSICILILSTVVDLYHISFITAN